MKLAFYKAFCLHGTWKEIMFDVLIGIFSLGRYSHVELVFSDGISFSSSLRDGGVRFAAIDYDNERWDVVDLPRFYNDIRVEELLRDDALSIVGLGYDKLGAITSIMPFCFQRRRRLFCSEMIINMFHARNVFALLTGERLENGSIYSEMGDGCEYSPSEFNKSIREIVG